MKINFLLAGSLLAIVGCGDNTKTNKLDAGAHDAAPDSGFPAAPTLGAQVDRLGRPAINTALNHTFDINSTRKQAAKDAYNQDSSPSTWQATYVGEFMKNLGMLDYLDDGIDLKDSAGNNQGSAIGWGAVQVMAPGPYPSLPGGCGNQFGYNAMLSPVVGATTPTATSYQFLAGLLADDQLIMDTAKTVCDAYLPVELDYATAGNIPHASCGGRAPGYDVIDFSYSSLTAGLEAFNVTITPAIPFVKDNAAKHGDVDQATFPFLGAPH